MEDLLNAVHTTLASLVPAISSNKESIALEISSF